MPEPSNEAAIRADEREACARIAEAYSPGIAGFIRDRGLLELSLAERDAYTSEVARLRARVQELEGARRLYWLDSDPEVSHDDLNELAYSYDLTPGTVKKIRRAVELPVAYIAVRSDPDDDDCLLVTEHATEAEAHEALAALTPEAPRG